jgi:hypothetical protein
MMKEQYNCDLVKYLPSVARTVASLFRSTQRVSTRGVKEISSSAMSSVPQALKTELNRSDRSCKWAIDN